MRDAGGSDGLSAGEILGLGPRCIACACCGGRVSCVVRLGSSLRHDAKPAKAPALGQLRTPEWVSRAVGSSCSRCCSTPPVPMARRRPMAARGRRRPHAQLQTCVGAAALARRRGYVALGTWTTHSSRSCAANVLARLPALSPQHSPRLSTATPC